MAFFEEVEVLKRTLLSWIIVFLVVSMGVFSMGFGTATISTYTLRIPVFSSESFATLFFQKVKKDVVPEGVTLIATSPISAFVSEMKIALLAAFVLTLPFLMYKLLSYLSPALYKKERRAVLTLFLPSIALFLLGAFFAYAVLIPPLFRVLYSFNAALGVAPFFAVDDFISWTVGLMFTVGIMFLLPILMYFLSLLRIIPAAFWGKHWRGACMISLVAFAVIVPDVSGIAMILLTLPMLALYLVGIGLSLTTAPKAEYAGG